MKIKLVKRANPQKKTEKKFYANAVINPTKRNVSLLQNEMCKFNISFYFFLHLFYLMFNNTLT